MYKIVELMASIISKNLRDSEVCVMGAVSQIPQLACGLARRTHCPNLNFVVGGSGALNPKKVSKSSCDFELLNSEGVLSLEDVIEFEGKSLFDVFFAGGLQIDRVGNCNLVVVGDWRKPKLKGPGTVGLPFLSRCKRFIIYTHTHDKRCLVEKVDFISGPGLNIGNPELLVTPLSIMEFRDEGVFLKSVHPGVSVEEVIEKTGFELEVPSKVPESKIPTERELEIMRDIDPEGFARNML
ncbi:MAG: CoA-transferase subunit beta [Candidatus Methanofastidiosia archaeon]